MIRAIIAVAVLSTFSFQASLASAQDFRTYRLDPNGAKERAAPMAVDDIQDPVFALMAGMIDQNLYGRVGQPELRAAVESAGGSKIPFPSLLWLLRKPSPQGNWISLRARLRTDMRAPAPYAILGYHPVTLVASRSLRLREWRLGDRTYGDLKLQNVTMWALESGVVQVDIDGWVDWVMGAKLDDIDIVGFALFRSGDARYGLAFGYAPDGNGRTGLLNLTQDEVMFPAPPEFLDVGRRLRAEAEQRIELGR